VTGAGGSDSAGARPATDAAAPDDLSLEQLAAEWEEDKPPAAGPLANVASAIVIGVVGIAGVVGSLGLGLGSPADPRPGMWPFIVSVILVLLAVALALFGRGATDTEKFSHRSWAVLGGTLSLIALVFLVPIIGFEIPSLLLTFIWLRFLGKETWKMSTLLSVIIVAAFYGIFVLLLGVPLPHLF
jgi:hypothetical protein